MQVLTRRANEGIVIDEEIEVTVLEIHADRVRLGCYSPRQTPSYWEQDLYCSPQTAWTPKRSVSLSVQ